MADVTVETRNGEVRGASLGPISVWKGIPFAKPPLGPLRFRPPQAPVSWVGVRNATKFGPVAMQANSNLNGLLGTEAVQPHMDEDCLYLNVWSPGTDEKKRPVLVWIHGGAFVTGSGSTAWYDGESFARGGMVVVTVNYRLGALGFLHLGELAGEDYASSGNCGLLDQIAALTWVRDNIEAFGGDPTNVTIFGESAGAMSIGALLAMPAARGLFQRAILQSGASSGVPSKETATEVANEFLALLGLDTFDSTSLMRIPADTLMAAQTKLLGSRRGLSTFRPVVDGVSLPTKPLQAIADGSADGVDILIGTTRDEMRLFTTMDPRQGIPNEDVLKQLFGASASEVLNTYVAARPDQSLNDAWVDILTERTFRIPAIRLAECQVKRGGRVWMYRFDWASSAFDGRLGACHALEIPFVWNNLAQPGAENFTGSSSARQPLADRMHAAWSAFACIGDPNISSLPEWPSYNTEHRSTMVFNEECHVMDDPQSTERRLWEGVI